MTRPSEQRLQTLGVVLRMRRERMGRPQDLQPWGGPSDFTVRGLEQAEGNVPRPKTRRQLEAALNLPDGFFDRVLAGEVDEDSSEMNDVVVRDTPPAMLHLGASGVVHHGSFAQATPIAPPRDEDVVVREDSPEDEVRNESEASVVEVTRSSHARTVTALTERQVAVLRKLGRTVNVGDSVTFASGDEAAMEQVLAALERAEQFRASGPLADALAALHRITNPSTSELKAIDLVSEAYALVLNDTRHRRHQDDDVHEPHEKVASGHTAVSNKSQQRERHILPAVDDGWQVQEPGSARASAQAPTQAEAVQRAIEIASENGGGRVVVHGADGSVRDAHDAHDAHDVAEAEVSPS